MQLSNIYFKTLQDVKKAIISDLVKLGREAGLKSFEQVCTSIILLAIFSY